VLHSPAVHLPSSQLASFPSLRIASLCGALGCSRIGSVLGNLLNRRPKEEITSSCDPHKVSGCLRCYSPSACDWTPLTQHRPLDYHHRAPSSHNWHRCAIRGQTAAQKVHPPNLLGRRAAIGRLKTCIRSVRPDDRGQHYVSVGGLKSATIVVPGWVLDQAHYNVVRLSSFEQSFLVRTSSFPSSLTSFGRVPAI
jgi:hypothetical protein